MDTIKTITEPSKRGKKYQTRLFWVLFVVPVALFVSPLLPETRMPREGEEMALGRCGYRASAFGFAPVPCGDNGKNIQVVTPVIGNDLYFQREDETGKPIGKLDVTTGEKSVIAGQGLFMSAVIVETRDHKTVPDGTEVEFLSEGKVAARGKTLGGVANTIYHAPLQTGTVEVAARIGEFVGVGNSIRVVPAEPVMLSVRRARGTGKVNDGEEIWFETELMKDQHGNRLEDGALVYFAGTDTSNRKVLLQGVVVNGIATAKIINRYMDGNIELIGHHRDIAGPPVTVEFEPVVFPPQLPANIVAWRGMINLEIGPLEDQLGRFVKNGMPFQLRLPEGRVLEEATDNGIIRFSFTNPQPDQPLPVTLAAGKQVWSLVIGEQTDGQINFNASIAPSKGGQS